MSKKTPTGQSNMHFVVFPVPFTVYYKPHLLKIQMPSLTTSASSSEPVQILLEEEREIELVLQ